LLAGVQAQLLGNLPESGNRASLKAIRIFAYAGASFLPCFFLAACFDVVYPATWTTH